MSFDRDEVHSFTTVDRLIDAASRWQ